jgi:hypothetical protein
MVFQNATGERNSMHLYALHMSVSLKMSETRLSPIPMFDDRLAALLQRHLRVQFLEKYTPTRCMLPGDSAGVSRYVSIPPNKISTLQEVTV